MTTARVLHVDAFSTQPGLGNPAGVLLDADGLGEAAIREMAIEVPEA